MEVCLLQNFNSLFLEAAEIVKKTIKGDRPEFHSGL